MSRYHREIVELDRGMVEGERTEGSYKRGLIGVEKGNKRRATGVDIGPCAISDLH